MALIHSVRAKFSYALTLKEAVSAKNILSEALAKVDDKQQKKSVLINFKKLADDVALKIYDWFAKITPESTEFMKNVDERLKVVREIKNFIENRMHILDKEMSAEREGQGAAVAMPINEVEPFKINPFLAIKFSYAITFNEISAAETILNKMLDKTKDKGKAKSALIKFRELADDAEKLVYDWAGETAQTEDSLKAVKGIKKVYR